MTSLRDVNNGCRFRDNATDLNVGGLSSTSHRREVDREVCLAETQFLRRISPDLEIPYTIQTGLGIERQITKSMIATSTTYSLAAFICGARAMSTRPSCRAAFRTLASTFKAEILTTGPQRPEFAQFQARMPMSFASTALQIRLDWRNPGCERRARAHARLNAPRSSNITAALNALRSLRPEPLLTQVELRIDRQLVLSRLRGIGEIFVWQPGPS